MREDTIQEVFRASANHLNSSKVHRAYNISHSVQGCVCSFIRTSRREKSSFPPRVLKLLKNWEKLKMLNGILYRVCRDLTTGKKRHQYVMPLSLVGQ